MPTSLFRVAAFAAVLSGVHAQELLLDVNPRVATGAASIGHFAEGATANGLAFLSLHHRRFGPEPWVTDGTAAGTRLLADLGSARFGPRDFRAFAGGVLFHTSSALYWTDGTTAGTVRLGSVLALPGTATPVGNLAFFTAADSGVGHELWVTDGTVAGTRLVADLEPGLTGSEPQAFVDFGGVALFRARVGGATRLFRSDGTATGTFEVAPGMVAGTVAEIAVAGSTAWFTTGDSDLWRTDGTPSGTVQLRSGFVGRPRGFAALGGSMLFTANEAATGPEPWLSDGTAAGTRLLLDVHPGPTGSRYLPTHTVLDPSTALFEADDGRNGRELWRTDGTAAGTMLVRDLRPGAAGSDPMSLAALGGSVWFQADDGVHGVELWISDGTSAGTRLVRDVHPLGDSSPVPMTAIGGEVVFAADDGLTGYEPWLSDGTAAGTRRLGDFAVTPRSSDPEQFAAYGLRALFSADDGTNGREPWITDGSAAGTRLLADLAPGATGTHPSFHGTWLGRAWFTASTPAHGSELWSSDGTPAGTSILLDAAVGTLGSSPYSFLPLGEVALFAANPGSGWELWVTDGTAAGTRMIDIDPASAAGPGDLVRLGDHAYFLARHSAHGQELWRSDGTAAGTQLVVDLVPGPGDALIRELRVSGGALWFAGSDRPGGPFAPDVEPWTSDGTAAGTRRVADLLPGIASSNPGAFVEFDGETWFTATATRLLPTLFASDGTAAGTRAIADHVQGELVPAGERLFFMKDGEIWSTDGTTGGTTLTRDIWPGTTSSQPEELTAAGTFVLFTARDTLHGRELWISDGTTGGTEMVRDLWPGVLAGDPGAVTRVGDAVFFGADDGASGREPFVLPLAELGAALADHLAHGCAGSAGVPRISATGIPRLGEPAFTVALDDARALAPAALLMGTTLLSGADVARCVPALPSSAALVPFLTNHAGTAAIPLAIPTDPSLQGIQLFAQWIVLDPQGRLFGLLAQSRLLHLLIGR